MYRYGHNGYSKKKENLCRYQQNCRFKGRCWFKHISDDETDQTLKEDRLKIIECRLMCVENKMNQIIGLQHEILAVIAKDTDVADVDKILPEKRQHKNGELERKVKNLMSPFMETRIGIAVDERDEARKRSEAYETAVKYGDSKKVKHTQSRNVKVKNGKQRETRNKKKEKRNIILARTLKKQRRKSQQKIKAEQHKKLRREAFECTLASSRAMMKASKEEQKQPQLYDENDGRQHELQTNMTIQNHVKEKHDVNSDPRTSADADDSKLSGEVKADVEENESEASATHLAYDEKQLKIKKRVDLCCSLERVHCYDQDLMEVLYKHGINNKKAFYNIAELDRKKILEALSSYEWCANYSKEQREEKIEIKGKLERFIMEQIQDESDL